MGSADQASQTGPIRSIDVEPFVVEIMGGTGFASESPVVWLSGEIDLAATVFAGSKCSQWTTTTTYTAPSQSERETLKFALLFFADAF